MLQYHPLIGRSKALLDFSRSLVRGFCSWFCKLTLFDTVISGQNVTIHSTLKFQREPNEALVESRGRREFTQFLPQTIHQIHTKSARNSSVPARFRTSEKGGVSKRLLFPSLSYSIQVFGFFFPLEVSRVQSDSFSQAHSKRAWSTAGYCTRPIRPSRPRLPFVRWHHLVVVEKIGAMFG